MNRKRQRNRVPARRIQLVSKLRERVLCGEWAPGQKLPSRDALWRMMQVSPTTLQRAMDQLQHDGFVQARGPRGTFVVDYPPHSSRYAVVFPLAQAHERRWRQMFTALEQELRRAERRGRAQFPVYYADDELDPKSSRFGELERDIRSHRVAGVIFASPPSVFHHRPVLDLPGIPRVVMASFTPMGLPYVAFDYDSLMTRSLAQLAAQGCQRIACIGPSMAHGTTRSLRQTWESSLHQHGLECVRHWWLGVDLEQPEGAQEIAKVLLDREPDRRPDGLIVADEHLLNHVLVGALELGLQLGADLKIVGHASFPDPAIAMRPVSRVGFNMAEALAACVARVEEQRRGLICQPATIIPAQFEEELTPLPPKDERIGSPTQEAVATQI